MKGGEIIMSTFDRVKKIVVDQLGVNEADVTIDSTFIDDLGADSLDIVELIMAFEEEFDIEIPDDAAEKIKTVKNAVDYIDRFSNQKVIVIMGPGKLFPRQTSMMGENASKKRITGPLLSVFLRSYPFTKIFGIFYCEVLLNGKKKSCYNRYGRSFSRRYRYRRILECADGRQIRHWPDYRI